MALCNASICCGLAGWQAAGLAVGLWALIFRTMANDTKHITAAKMIKSKIVCFDDLFCDLIIRSPLMSPPVGDIILSMKIKSGFDHIDGRLLC